MARARFPATDDVKIIVGVDFGTTYSALAYVKTTDPHERFIIEEWGPGTPSAPKVPTLLKYRNDDRTKQFEWGFKAKACQGKKHEWFKLDLHPFLELSELARRYPSTTALPPLTGLACEKLATDYLTMLRQAADNYFRSHRINTHRVGTVPIPVPRQYIITVPAVWPEGAQAAIRRCAEAAGMGGNTRIISEPEAAGIYALEKMRGSGLKAGDTFVVCDAGGGTVDLVSYTVARLDPPRVVEAASGSGGMCGSSFLNRIFAAHLREKFLGYRAWDDDFQDEALRKFEDFKQTFLEDAGPHFVLRVRSLPDSPRRGIENHVLTIPRSVIAEQIFKPVIQEIQSLVRRQVDRTTQRSGKPVKTVLLAGGFGQSEYLLGMLEREVEGDGIKVQKVENSNTAIVRGALIRGLAREMPHLPIFVPEARIARKHYGTMCWVDYDENRHDPERKVLDELSGQFRIEIMQWFVKKHTSIKESEAKKFTFRVEQEPGNRGTLLEPAHIDIYVYDDPDDEGPPPYKIDGVTRSMRLTAEFQEIPPGAITMEQSWNGARFARVSFEVEMKLYSANLGFSMVVPGKRYEEVHVEFDN